MTFGSPIWLLGLLLVVEGQHRSLRWFVAPRTTHDSRHFRLATPGQVKKDRAPSAFESEHEHAGVAPNPARGARWFGAMLRDA